MSITIERWSTMKMVGFCAMEVPVIFTELFVVPSGFMHYSNILA